MTKRVNVMSFDIGIKNMAYCIISVDTDVKIIDWRVIDISKNGENNNESVVEKCSCKNKTTFCKKKAKYVKNGQFYCEKHAKTSLEYKVPEKRLTSTTLKKTKLTELEIIVDEFAIPGMSVKMNKKELLEKMEVFFCSKLFQKIDDVKIVKTQNINLIELGRNMAKILDKVPDLGLLTHVILENQISTLANRMKTIQGMLAQYFIMRFGDAVVIEFVSSSNKLKSFPKNTEESTSDNNYKQHKSDAVFYTKEILIKNALLNSCCPNDGESWIDALVSKKKDDLCDSFLQGIWYLNKMKYIIFDTNYMINKS
jgi:hypothetical protein